MAIPERVTLQRDRTIPRLRPVGSGRQVAARFGVLETKLEPPLERAGLVRRTALLARLAAARSVATVLVRAPAGYGKTSLLAQWAGLDERPVAWLSLDRHDDDPIRLAGLLAAGVDRISPLDPGVIRAVHAASTSDPAGLLPALGLAARAVGRPILLIVDDVQVLHDRAAVELLGGFAASLPLGSQLALGARGQPALPIARLRAAGDLFELGPDDLALDPSEAAEALRGAGLEPTKAEVVSLRRRTEGWPAGLVLTALAIRAASPDPTGRSTPGDRDRFLADYLRSEVVAGLTPSQERFLIRSSVLARLDGPLCDAVVGRRGSAAMLATIERADLFLVPLDRERRSYRYHPFVKAMLEDLLEEREPGRRPELLLRAADRCEAEGRYEEALGYVFDAGDLDRAADLFERVALPVFRSGRQTTVRGWLDRLDDRALERHPSAAALAGLAFAFVGEARDADQWVARADRASRSSRDPTATGTSGSSVTSLVALARATTLPDGVDRMAADAAASLALESDWSPWRPFALLVDGVSRILLGDLVGARSVLADVDEVGQRVGADSARSIALAELAVLAIEAGEWSVAEVLAGRSRAVVMNAALDDYPVSALSFAVSARVTAHRGDVIRARQELAHLARISPSVTYALPWLAIQVRAEMARAYLSLRAVDEARELLGAMEAILDRRPDVGTLRPKVDGLRERISRSTNADRLETLTQAELRLIPLLPTHLSFIEIARLQVLSPNTVKTQAISIYRKLGASSRSDAVTRARDLGLLDG